MDLSNRARHLIWACFAVVLISSGPVEARTKPLTRELKIRNKTPFIVMIHVGGVRAGWIKPFRTATFKGLKDGYHKIYATSRYGSAAWGPRQAAIPGYWNLTPPAGTRSDVHAALVSRVYRRNRSSLMACDKLAKRRGEEVKGTRTDFVIKVSPDGKGIVKVSGESTSARRRSCYGAVTHQWEYPNTGQDYEISFQHIP